MLGMISNVNGNAGGAGGDVDRFLKIEFDLSGITPVESGEPPQLRYSYSFHGYPICYIVDTLGTVETVSITDVLHYHLIPIANNDEDNTGVTYEFDGLNGGGIIRSATNNLQSASFYFQWFVDLSQDYLIVKNNLTYREPLVIPVQDQEKYIQTIIDLTGITPSTEVVNGKSYNKFTFTSNEIDVWTMTNNGQLDAIPVADMRIYQVFPISSNNNDMGLYMSYDGTSFDGYVLSQQSSLTEVSFMFDFYIDIMHSGFTWQNYVDMLNVNSGGSGGSASSLSITDVPITNKSCVGYKSISSNSVPSGASSYTENGDNSDFVRFSGTCSQGYSFTTLMRNGAKLSTSDYSNLIVEYATPRFNLLTILATTQTPTVRITGTYELYNNDVLVHTVDIDVTTISNDYVTLLNTRVDIDSEIIFNKCIIKIKGSTSSPTLYIHTRVSLLHTCNSITLPVNSLSIINITSNTGYDIYSLNDKPYFYSFTNYIDKLPFVICRDGYMSPTISIIQ